MLEKGTILLWVVELDADLGSAERWYGRLLSPAERDRADAFRGGNLRRDFITSHAALRVFLGCCLDADPASIAFRPIDQSGTADPSTGLLKPALLPGSHPGINFNLSHTQGKALIGATLDCAIGVDIERHRPVEIEADLAGMARAVMSREEFSLWSALSSRDRTRAFYHLWTRKESYIKATGLGMYAALSQITVPVWPHHLLDPEPVQDENAASGTWQVRDLAVDSGHSASVCWHSEDVPEVELHQLDTRSLP